MRVWKVKIICYEDLILSIIVWLTAHRRSKQQIGLTKGIVSHNPPVLGLIGHSVSIFDIFSRSEVSEVNCDGGYVDVVGHTPEY